MPEQEEPPTATVRLVFECEVAVFDGDDRGRLIREAEQMALGNIADRVDAEVALPEGVTLADEA